MFCGNELGPKKPFECGYIIFCMIAAAMLMLIYLENVIADYYNFKEAAAY